MNCQNERKAWGGDLPPHPDSAIEAVLRHFRAMVDHCYEYAGAARKQGRPVVGIMCEYTPRELILAAGGVPVCLCGGSAGTIAAAEPELPASLCPLIKSTYGYCVQGTNPFLEWADLVVAETTCDGKKKMFELMAARKPMYVLELPQKPDEPEALTYWTNELWKFKEHLEVRFQTEVTTAKLRAAIQLMNRERALRRGLAETMAHQPPPLKGRELLDLKSIISGIPADLCMYETALRRLAETNGGRVEARPPVRVLLTGVPVVHGAERVVELIEAAGAVVVAMENCTGLKPLLEDVDETDPDPVSALARKYYHLPCSVMMGNRGRFESLRRLAQQYRAECVIELIWQGCLTYEVEAGQVRKLVEEELRLPYLKLVTDYSSGDSGRLSSRIEALMEVVRARVSRGADGDASPAKAG